MEEKLAATSVGTNKEQLQEHRQNWNIHTNTHKRLADGIIVVLHLSVACWIVHGDAVINCLFRMSY